MNTIGLTRREMERELAWLLRSPPSDPRELSKVFAGALVTVVEKNNRRIAEQLSRASDPGDVEDDL
jgi:hypothetical protein